MSQHYSWLHIILFVKNYSIHDYDSNPYSNIDIINQINIDKYTFKSPVPTYFTSLAPPIAGIGAKV